MDQRFPQMLSADAIDAIARNANSLKALAGVVHDKDDRDDHCDDCCCPKLLKFKFWFSHITIINENAECEEHKERHCC